MVAFIQNLNFTELAIIAIVAVLVFGRRLPEVAGQAARGLAKAKRTLQEVRRQSGLDEELTSFRQSVAQARQQVDDEVSGVYSAPRLTERPASSMARGAGEPRVVPASAETLGTAPAASPLSAPAASDPAPAEARDRDESTERPS